VNQRFKVGDGVVVVETEADALRGQEAEVVRCSKGKNGRAAWYRVRLNNKRELYFRGYQLDHQKGKSNVS